MAPLDRMLGGGIRPGELMLIGGAQGTGKTTMALQMARNIAASGQAYVLYVCFEHDEADMLNRLMAMESALPHLPNTKPSTGAVKITDVRREVLRSWARAGRASRSTCAPIRGSSRRSSASPATAATSTCCAARRRRARVENLRELIDMHRAQVRRAPDGPDRRLPPEGAPDPGAADRGREGHLRRQRAQGHRTRPRRSPTIAIVAADKEGLKAARLRNHHLRGSSAINYEADVILILNEKYHIVAKVNIEFNPYQAQRFRDWIDRIVEKNRTGARQRRPRVPEALRLLVLRPHRPPVQEKLIEERLYND